MLNLERLARPSIIKLRAYQSARSLASEAEIFLDANESAVGTYNRYPQPQPRELIKRFSALYNVGPDCILVGRGSDEGIDLLTRSFCEPREDEIVITPPTYGMYRVAADIQDVRVMEIPLRLSLGIWNLDVESIAARVNEINNRTKIIYLCSPGNPTAASLSKDEVRSVCEATANRCLVVIDEAYAEFCEDRCFLDFLKEYPHVVILRTLSKAWALAGLRCGVKARRE